MCEKMAFNNHVGPIVSRVTLLNRNRLANGNVRVKLECN
jgi:hypothetical protein